MGGIWVRSQNREELLNVKAVTYQEEDLLGNKNKIIGWVASECYFVIGKYAAKERALQVLDEIQYAICYIERTKLYDGNISCSTENDLKQFVYQMPES